jgi:glycogenin glucosyltransferase
VLRNSDELFEEEELSAAPDIGWPDYFHTGVFVFRPSEETYRTLCALANSKGSLDGQSLVILPRRTLVSHIRFVGSISGRDQGLLNTHFSDWREKQASFRLLFKYNMSSVCHIAASHLMLLNGSPATSTNGHAVGPRPVDTSPSPEPPEKKACF